jgi:hypothetical protein
MVIYEVTATVAPERAGRYEEFMREDHIPALLATGCFRAASISRAEPGRYRACYEAPDRAALERYLRELAPRFREEFAHEFPAGVALTRETWELLHRWP